MSSLRGAGDPSSACCLRSKFLSPPTFHCSLGGLTKRELVLETHLLFLLIAQSRKDTLTESAGQDASITVKTFRVTPIVSLASFIFRNLFMVAFSCHQDTAFNRLELIVINYFPIINEKGILSVYY